MPPLEVVPMLTVAVPLLFDPTVVPKCMVYTSEEFVLLMLSMAEEPATFCVASEIPPAIES